MAQLAIKGHATRGSEVIELLEMLGGVNAHNLYGDENFAYYTIDSDTEIKGGIYVSGDEQLCCLTLEQFEEKFPYKVGDKVNAPCKGCVKTITSMKWDGYLNTVTYKLDDREFTNISQLKVVNELPSAEKESMEEKKKPQYPKTYKECFNICFGNYHHIIQVVGLDGLGNNKELFENFIKLKICRDAYWKIAGDWKPDFHQINQRRYYISSIPSFLEELLPFPTEEMRDVFYENFKDLINGAKELL